MRILSQYDYMVRRKHCWTKANSGHFFHGFILKSKFYAKNDKYLKFKVHHLTIKLYTEMYVNYLINFILK